MLYDKRLSSLPHAQAESKHSPKKREHAPRSGWLGLRLSARRRRRLAKTLLFLLSLFLFILAITLMKDGAASLTPLVRDRLHVNTPLRSLGFGWLFAYLVLSGSPVAAAALTLLNAGALTPASAFTMISGSRFGANFIVFAIGFLYVLRGRSRSASMSMGLLSLTVTGTTYLAALVIGLGLLELAWLDGLHIEAGPIMTSVFDRVFEPVGALLAEIVPPWGIFLLGLGLIMASFSPVSYTHLTLPTS